MTSTASTDYFMPTKALFADVSLDDFIAKVDHRTTTKSRRVPVQFKRSKIVSNREEHRNVLALTQTISAHIPRQDIHRRAIAK
jgi:hypothetical protein